jgi:hypothetical protein
MVEARAGARGHARRKAEAGHAAQVQDQATGIIRVFWNGGIAMPLQRGEVLGYDFNRMVVDFTMLNQGRTVRCAISTAAMDDIEGKHDVKADQRVDQFVRLREAIEERASQKFFERPGEAEGPVVLRSNDFLK